MTRSSSPITRSGVRGPYGSRVCGPERTIGPGRRAAVPNSSLASSRIRSLASRSLRPGATRPRAAVPAKRASAMRCVSTSPRARSRSSIRSGTDIAFFRFFRFFLRGRAHDHERSLVGRPTAQVAEFFVPGPGLQVRAEGPVEVLADPVVDEAPGRARLAGGRVEQCLRAPVVGLVESVGAVQGWARSGPCRSRPGPTPAPRRSGGAGPRCRGPRARTGTARSPGPGRGRRSG